MHSAGKPTPYIESETAMGLDHDPRSPDKPGVEEEVSVVISPDGTVVFSWNSPAIQALARLLGEPEFDPPRWCG